MDDQIDEYSEVNRVHCFLHIVNLIAKAMMKQFDASKQQKDSDAVDDKLEVALTELVADLDHEEWVMQAFGNGVTEDDTDDDDADDVEVYAAIVLSVVFLGLVRSGFLSQLGGNHNRDWFFLYQNQRDCN